MSGASPGGGHPGRGNSPSKAQASRPTLGSNAQVVSKADASPKVVSDGKKAQNGSSSTSSKKDEAVKVQKVTEQGKAMAVGKKVPVKQSASQGKQSEGQLGEIQKKSTGEKLNGGKQPAAQEVPSPSSGVQLTPSRQRRTSLERQTLQENLQQKHVVASMAGSGRTRSQSGGSSKSAVEPGATKPAVVKVKETSGFKHPGTLLKAGSQEETPCAPELQVAEEIPGLVKRLGELQQHKDLLQKQIEMGYNVKAANPGGDHTFCDQTLNMLGIQLAKVVTDMDCVLEKMGPLAETYRNQELFMAHKQDSAGSSSDIVPGGPQKPVRPVLQPASFCFQKGQMLQPQQPAADPKQQHVMQIPAGVPQVSECPAQQPAEDSKQQHGLHFPAEGLQVSECQAQQLGSGHVPVITDGAQQGSDAGDNRAVSGGLGAWGSTVYLVDAAQSDNDIDVDDNNVHDNVCDFPPLISSTQGVAAPPAADLHPVSQPNVTPHGPPSNAWSRGAPSFTSGTNYTGQAFKRRNVVRFRHRGAKEDLPDRRFVIRELLCHQMGFVPVSILAVINLPDRQGYDVSFKLMSDLDRFWSSFPKFRDSEGWSKFSFIPISKPDTVTVNVIFWNESVPPQDIVVWLRRHCDLVSDLTKSRDSDGIWTGGWRVLVKLSQCNNITAHLPNSFFIGRERGVYFYPGQPRKCFKCGKAGHLANTCTVVKCSLCGEVGHLAADCQNIRCNLCGKIGHPHRDCPDAWHNICKDFPDEDLVAGAEILEEAALLSGEILTRPEVHQGSTQLTPEQQGSEREQGSMEVVPQGQRSQEGITSVLPSVSEEYSNNQKRKKKDKASRKPEGYDTGQGAGKKFQSSAGVMVVSNRFDVLSESDGDFEDDLKRIDAECDRDVEDCPPPKRKPLPEGTRVESEMETGGEQNNSDSDL
ncbi:uncharacterized protein [Dendrobates tinctorius]|uniref:uncharacterized protein n=1 Tax=Dendrobates tinctorius TaxID=92724 RepID=UPI003CC9DF9D